MSKPQNNVEQVKDLLTKATSAADRLAILQEQEYLERHAEKTALREQAEAFREATIAGVTKMMADKAASQNICPHMKPNFRPATGGQKDHSGNYHFICQYCGKEFGNDLPGYLRISAEMIGGPQ